MECTVVPDYIFMVQPGQEGHFTQDSFQEIMSAQADTNSNSLDCIVAFIQPVCNLKTAANI